jgi:hypothetical protein
MNRNTLTVPAPTEPATARTPWQVRVLAAVTALLVLVTSYGAIYFSFWFEDPDPGLGTWVFVTEFLGINVVAAVAAVALVRRQRSGWQTLVGYTVVGMLWCVAKLVFWQETESLVFGAANLLCLGLLLAPRTRAHASR